MILQELKYGAYAQRRACSPFARGEKWVKKFFWFQQMFSFFSCCHLILVERTIPSTEQNLFLVLQPNKQQHKKEEAKPRLNLYAAFQTLWLKSKTQIKIKYLLHSTDLFHSTLKLKSTEYWLFGLTTSLRYLPILGAWISLESTEMCGINWVLDYKQSLVFLRDCKASKPHNHARKLPHARSVSSREAIFAHDCVVRWPYYSSVV